MGGEAWLPWAKAPQRVSRLLVCRTPCLDSVLHARTRVPQSLVRARCSLPHRVHPSEPPPLRSTYSSTRALYQSLQALVAFESVTPSSLLPSRSSRAGCPSPATCPVRALRCEPAASSASQPLARGVRADPGRGQQRAGWQQSGMGWADAGGGRSRL